MYTAFGTRGNIKGLSHKRDREIEEWSEKGARKNGVYDYMT